MFSSSRIAADGVDERTRTNGEGGRITGLELVWHQNFDFLPAPFDGFGFEANFTYLDSKARYPGRTDNLPLTLSPDTIFNYVLSYTTGPFSVRVSYNRLAERLESVGSRPALDLYNAKSEIWDLAFRYQIFGNGSLFLNVKNLRNAPTVQYQGDPSNPRSVVFYGRQYNFGVRFDF